MGKNIRIIVLVFLVVIMFFVWNSFFKKLRRVKRYSKAATVYKEEDVSRTFTFWANKEIKKRSYSKFKEEGRNPFTLAKGITAMKGLDLMGILWDVESPQAIINGEIVGVGDMIKGNEVIAILKDRVILKNDEKKFELEL